jgi:hypothetical protein
MNKQEILDLAKHPLVALTGRVENWLKDTTGRLPVSCTVLAVQDRMDERDGIEDSWQFTSKALRYGAGVAINLSALRPAGTVSPNVTASGPASFAKIYSTLNEIIRRGGRFKNGAVNLHLDSNHADAKEFIEIPVDRLPWAKRTLTVHDNLLKLSYLDSIIKQMQSGFLWLSKARYDNGKQLYGNVCNEIFLPSRGTCLLQHVNLGMCQINDIPDAFEYGMKMLCAMHPITGVGDSGIYLPPELDKQVGLGVIGLASLLAIEDISYLQLTEAWEQLLQTGKAPKTKAGDLAKNLVTGLTRAAEVAKTHGMRRSLTIAPTASCAYRYYDRDGYTTTPEISPPIAKEVDRYSGIFGVQTYDHHPRVETALEVGYDLYFRLADCWQKSMNATGQAHAISFNIWDTQVIDKDFLERWQKSSLWTTYYRLPVRQPEFLDKTIIQQNSTCGLSADDCVACAE